MSTPSSTPNGNGDMPFAKHLFEAADRLRGSVESAEYKHLVLGLLFLKYVSDSFQLRRDQLEAETRTPGSGVYTEDEAERKEILEDRDEYAAENVFWVPVEARWDALLAAASLPDVGVRIDRALEAVERENTSLRGVLPHVYARAALSPEKLGELVTTIAKIGFGENPEEARDVLGRTYEYFIKTFARDEAGRGDQKVLEQLLVDPGDLEGALERPDHLFGFAGRETLPNLLEQLREVGLMPVHIRTIDIPVDAPYRFHRRDRWVKSDLTKGGRHGCMDIP